MRNFENGYNSSTNSGNTGWEIIEGGYSEQRVAEESNQESMDDDFEQRRIKRLEERLRKSEEAKATMMKKAKVLAASAIMSVALIGALVASGVFSTHEIMDTEHAKEVETFYVESVTLTDGPYFRKEPVVSSDAEGSNIIMDFGEEGQKAEIPYQGKAYYYRNEYDPNGGWYGFPAEEFANVLFENGFISKKEAEQLAKKDNDKTFWVNDGFSDVDKIESVQN